MSAPEKTIEERVRALYERLGIAPVAMPAPPDDAPAPPPHWQDDRDDGEKGDER